MEHTVAERRLYRLSNRECIAGRICLVYYNRYSSLYSLYTSDSDVSEHLRNRNCHKRLLEHSFSRRYYRLMPINAIVAYERNIVRLSLELRKPSGNAVGNTVLLNVVEEERHSQRLSSRYTASRRIVFSLPDIHLHDRMLKIVHDDDERSPAYTESSIPSVHGDIVAERQGYLARLVPRSPACRGHVCLLQNSVEEYAHR